MLCQFREDFFRAVTDSLLQNSYNLLLGHKGGFGLFAAILAKVIHELISLRRILHLTLSSMLKRKNLTTQERGF